MSHISTIINPNTLVKTLTGNTGGAVASTGGNINVVGSGLITVAGTPGTSTLTITSSGTVPSSFVTDAGTATPALGVLTVAGGTNIGTTGAGSTVTINLDSAVSGLTSVAMATGGTIGTGTTAADTAYLSAYNTGTATYTTFATLTAGVTPTMDLADTVTKAGNYIYRAGGTDVAIADGGTGISTTPTDGQLLIGKTSTNNYVLSTLTAGAGIAITNGSGSITISGGGGGIAWSEQAVDFTMAVDNGYIANKGTLLTATLPATAAQGTVIRIQGKGIGLFAIAQNAGQTIHFGTSSTTTGVGGSITSQNTYDSIELVCITADTDFAVMSSVGNFTIV